MILNFLQTNCTSTNTNTVKNIFIAIYGWFFRILISYFDLGGYFVEQGLKQFTKIDDNHELIRYFVEKITYKQEQK